MANKYQIQKSPNRAPSKEGKLINEHFGLASIPFELSISHMVAPSKWRESFQIPDFDEYTFD